MKKNKQPWVCVVFYVFAVFAFIGAWFGLTGGSFAPGFAALLSSFLLYALAKIIALIARVAFIAEALLLETIRQRPTT